MGDELKWLLKEGGGRNFEGELIFGRLWYKAYVNFIMLILFQPTLNFRT